MLFLVLIRILKFDYFQDGTLKSEVITNDLLPNIDKVVAAALSENALDEDSKTPSPPKSPLIPTKIDLALVVDFLEGKHCLTGVSIFISTAVHHLSTFIFIIITVQMTISELRLVEI